MDAAIEFEDAWPVDGRAEERIGTMTEASEKNVDGVDGVDKVDVLDELVEALRDYARARALVYLLCKRVVGQDLGAGPETAALGIAVAGAAGPGLAQAEQSRASAVRPRRAKVAKMAAEAGQVYEPWKKVKCVECVGHHRGPHGPGPAYPTGHYRPDNQTICPGRGKPAALATDAEIAASKEE